MNNRQLARTCTIEKVASWENLFAAAAKARRGKSRRPDVEDWWMRRESELSAIRSELLSGRYEPGGYRFFEIREPKRRMIAAAPFRDRVLHHALCNILGPVLERQFIARSFSCQVGKGTTAARECCRQLVNHHRYVLKCDIRKFFPSIDHQILLAMLDRKVACRATRELIRRIVGSFQTGRELPAIPFDGEDRVVAEARPRGLPIGNLTSQLWGNFYLDRLDHCLTEGWRHGAMLRYTDDFLIFDDDASTLQTVKHAVAAKLGQLRLQLAETKSRVLAVREGVPFCGFQFFPGLRPRVLGATKRRFEERRERLVKRRAFRLVSETVFAWYQFSREGNTTGLRQAYMRQPWRRKTSCP